MAWRSGGSISRSLISAARAPSLRSPPPINRLRPPPTAAPRLQSRRVSFAPSREEWKRRVMHGTQSAKGAGLMPQLYLKGHSDQHRQVQHYVEDV